MTLVPMTRLPRPILYKSTQPFVTYQEVFMNIFNSSKWQAGHYTKDNQTILYDVPVLLNERMQSCVLESNEYQNTHNEYINACRQLRYRILQLHNKRVALDAVDAFLASRTNAHSDPHVSKPAVMSSAMKLRLQQHASLISLTVSRQVRENKFRTAQEHIQDLKDLRTRHDLALNQLRTRIESHILPDCL